VNPELAMQSKRQVRSPWDLRRFLRAAAPARLFAPGVDGHGSLDWGISPSSASVRQRG